MPSASLYAAVVMLLLWCGSCKPKADEVSAAAESPAAETPVTVTPVIVGPLNQYVELNATSTFLQSNIVKAYTNGYVKAVAVSPGQFVQRGALLFSIQTKESTNIGGIINNLDSSYHFSGTTGIRASQTGYITQLNHQVGDYVQDGEQLAAISTSNSFGFLLNVPYEMKKFISLRKQVEIELPDGNHLQGSIATIMPAVDSASQTQRVLVHVDSKTPIPENLIARVKIMILQKPTAVSLPKEAVLSDESQASFWVMKLLDSATAVKVPVTPGIALDGKVEIVEPKFMAGELILVSGNYGLGDTARVKIVKAGE